MKVSYGESVGTPSSFSPLPTKFILEAITKNNLNPKSIKEEDFFKKNILHKSKGPVKLLNVGELKTPINIEISFASKKAIEQIKAAGGNIKTTVNN